MILVIICTMLCTQGIFMGGTHSFHQILKWLLNPKWLRTTASEKPTWPDMTLFLCCPLSAQLRLANFSLLLPRGLSPWDSSAVIPSPYLRMLPQMQEWSRNWMPGSPAVLAPHSRPPRGACGYTMSNHRATAVREDTWPSLHLPHTHPRPTSE